MIMMRFRRHTLLAATLAGLLTAAPSLAEERQALRVDAMLDTGEAKPMTPRPGQQMSNSHAAEESCEAVFKVCKTSRGISCLDQYKACTFKR
jgi:hypothetical protein